MGRCRRGTYQQEHQRRCYQCHQRSGWRSEQGCSRVHLLHGQSGGNVCGAEDHVALATTSALCNRVGVSFDLEDQTFELLNRPATVGVGVEVESTKSCYVGLCTRLSRLVDGTDDFTVDLGKDFSGENVGKFCFSIQTVDCLEVLCEFQGVFCLSGHVT